MNNNLVRIRLHGQLGQEVREEWNLAVESVSEAINAIEILSKRKLYKFLAREDQRLTKYQVLINNEDFVTEEPLDDLNHPERVQKSDLIVKKGDLKTIDIVPVIEGASHVLNIILGVLIIIVGAIVAFLPGGQLLGAGIIVVGLGLLASGVMGLLAKPPDIGDFRSEKKTSYLFNGPENVVGEGGPVPVGYGRLLVGSQVVSAAYKTYDVKVVNGVLSDGITHPEVNPNMYTEALGDVVISGPFLASQFPLTKYLRCTDNAFVRFKITDSDTVPNKSDCNDVPLNRINEGGDFIAVSIPLPVFGQKKYLHYYAEPKIGINKPSSKMYVRSFWRKN